MVKKQTEIGLIPEDWEVKKLAQIVHFKNGAAHENYVDDNGDFVIVNSKFISQDGKVRKYSKEYLCPLFENEITMVMSDIPNGKALAKCFIVDKDNTYTLNQRICAFEAKNGFNAKYLYYKINRNEYFLSFDSGSGQTNLRKDEVLNCFISFPPLAEQEAIANALSDADAWIEKLEQLIAKKRLIKQGAMQTLLTPKEDWELKKLGEVCDFLKGKDLPKSDLSLTGVYECIHYGELFTTYKESIKTIKSYTNNNSNKIYSKHNDVLMPTSDVTPRGLATASCIKKDNVILGGDILIIRFNGNIDGVYFSYFISNNKEEVLKYVSGSTVYHLYGSELANLNLYFPSLSEQERIATILSDMDAEIEALEQQLGKARHIKQGMMQELLTGRTRLV